MQTPGFCDVDQHIIEPADLFDVWGSAALKDSYPQYGVRDGHVGWTFEDTFYAISKAATQAGRPWGQSGVFVPSETVPDGLGDPVARVKAMDEDGVEMAFCYPSFMGLGGETMTRHVIGSAITKRLASTETAASAIEAYNRWMKDWCAVVPDRFIRAAIVPLWDPNLAARKIRIAALEGARAFFFPQDPEAVGLTPIWDRSWDPVWNAAATNGMVVATHTLSDSMGKYLEMREQPFLGLTLARMSGIKTIASWLLTDVLDRFPDLKVMVGEAGVGWLPWFLDLAQTSVRLAKYEFGRPKLSPIEKAEQCLGLPLLAGEAITAGMIEALPSGLQRRIMFATDYPHLDGSWPQSRAGFAALDIPPHLALGIARTHALDFFGIEK